MHHFDIIIIGGGPAGCAAAIELQKSGVQVALIDKARFPRDKVCGDGLSVDVVNQLPKLSPQLYQRFLSMPGAFRSPSILFFSPRLRSFLLPAYYRGKPATGYTCTRLEFDNLLFEYTQSLAGVKLFEGCAVDRLVQTGEGIEVHTSDQILRAKLVIGADGAQSVVARQLGDRSHQKAYASAGLRQYYEGVSGCAADGAIELHFLRGILPGYFWIFPLAGGRANVGIAVLSDVVSRQKLDLKKILQAFVDGHAHLRHRFAGAKSLESPKGFILPLGHPLRRISGDRFLLTGDAAGLIDPLSGEGIANALRSGRMAAAHAVQCLQTNDFSAVANRRYDAAIYRAMGREFWWSRLVQRLSRREGFVNGLVWVCGRFPVLRRWLFANLH